MRRRPPRTVNFRLSVFSLFSVSPFKILNAKSRETPKFGRTYGVWDFGIPPTGHRNSWANTETRSLLLGENFGTLSHQRPKSVGRHRNRSLLLGENFGTSGKGARNGAPTCVSSLNMSLFIDPCICMSQDGINFRSGHEGWRRNSRFHAVLVHNPVFHLEP